MIHAVLFDLDGTLVQSERIKAISYARAATQLCPECASEDEVMQAFKDVVGLSRQEVAQTLVKRFGLEDAARQRMDEFGVNTPWQAYVQLRLKIFEDMIDDPRVIQESECPHAINLLREVRNMGLRAALTTTSSCSRATRALEVLGIRQEFEFIATADDVEHTKPDPEVYNLITCEMKLAPQQCLAIEDSLPGVQAAHAANVWCIAATNEFTRDSVHNAHPLDDRWIVDDPATLNSTAKQVIAEHANEPDTQFQPAPTECKQAA
jgi:HAD superfamily hydrolase (TIGR01509 family)